MPLGSLDVRKKRDGKILIKKWIEKNLHAAVWTITRTFVQLSVSVLVPAAWERTTAAVKNSHRPLWSHSFQQQQITGHYHAHTASVQMWVLMRLYWEPNTINPVRAASRTKWCTPQPSFPGNYTQFEGYQTSWFEHFILIVKYYSRFLPTVCKAARNTSCMQVPQKHQLKFTCLQLHCCKLLGMLC